MALDAVFLSSLCCFDLETGVSILLNPREQLMSTDLHCSCPKRLSRMIAVEYRAAALDDGMTAIYECARCGKRTTVVHRSKALAVWGTTKNLSVD
jgi:hypothetical protein